VVQAASQEVDKRRHKVVELSELRSVVVEQPAGPVVVGAGPPGPLSAVGCMPASAGGVAGGQQI